MEKDKRQRMSQMRKFNNFWGYLFILPQLIGLVVFFLIPIGITVYLCFENWDFINEPIFVGFSNFIEVFKDPVFIKTIGNTFFFVIGIVPLNLGLALFLAVMANRKIKFLGFFKASLFLPMVTSTVAISLIWYWIYAPDFGLLNLGLSFFGIAGPNWLSNPTWTKPALIIMCIWKGVGYSFLIFLAGLKGISTTYYEAASIDGANEIQKFKNVTLPLLSPVLFFMTVTSLISTFAIFNEAYMLTQGGPMYSSYTMMLYLYNYAFKFMKMGNASVVAMFMAIIQITFAVIQFRLSRKWVNYDA